MSQVRTLLTGLLLILLQITLLNLLSIKGIRPDLIVLFVVSRALAEGPTAAVAWGFGLGLALDIVSGTQPGLGALAYSLAGFCCGQISSGKGITWLRYIATLLLGAVITFAIFFYFREPWNQVGWTEPLLAYTIPGVIYTWCLGLIWALSPFSSLKTGK